MSFSLKGKSSLLAGLAISALLVVLAGCGAGPAWQGLIKVGFIAPFSGYDGGSAGQLLAGVRAAIAESNAAGGIIGHRVELVALDDSHDPEVASGRVAEMARDTSVLMAIAQLGGEARYAVSFDRARLPAIAVGSPVDVSESNAVRALCASPTEEGELSAKLAQNSERPAVVEWPVGGYRQAADAFARSLRASPSRLVATPPGNSSQLVSDLAAMAIDRNADLVFWSGPYEPATRFADALRWRGSVASVLLGSDADTPGLHALSGSGVLAYAKACQAKAAAGSLVEQRIAREAGERGLLGYLVAQRALGLLAAPEHHGQPTREGILAVLQQVQPLDGPISIQQVR